MFKTLVVLVAVAAVCVADMSVLPLPPKPEKYKHLEGCYIAELDQVIPFEESVQPNSTCVEYLCTRKYITYSSCGETMKLPSYCRLTFDDGLVEYPFCCGTIECFSSS